MPSLLPADHMFTGRALWGIHSLWAKVLADWQEAKKGDTNAVSHWDGIEFDKLAHFLHLIWNALKERKEVSFRSVYRSANGVHGPGPALERRDRQGYHHAVQALELIQDKLKALGPDCMLFDVYAHNYRGRRTYAVGPGREVTHIPTHLSDTLPPGWQSKDKQHVRALSTLVQRLSQNEIRALGTHQSSDQTLKAIEFNVFRQLFPSLVSEIQSIKEAFEKPNPAAEVTGSDHPFLMSVIEEIDRKSSTNKEAYSSGYTVIEEAARKGNATASFALQDVFARPDDIWVQKVTDRQQCARVLEWICHYIKAVRNIAIPASQPDDAAEKENLQKRIVEENKNGNIGRIRLSETLGVQLPPLPDDRGRAFPCSEILTAVVRVFEKLDGTTHYWDWFQDQAAGLRQRNEVL